MYRKKIHREFLKETSIILQRGAERESSCRVGMHWIAQYLGGCHSFTPSVFLGTYTMLGVGDIDMGKTERSLLSQNYQEER